jgi:four helix bundle protein
MDEEELKKRTKQFGLRIMKLVAALPNTPQGRTVGGQLVRAGTSVGANYRAACARVQEQSSLPDSVLLRKRPTRAAIG